MLSHWLIDDICCLYHICDMALSLHRFCSLLHVDHSVCVCVLHRVCVFLCVACVGTHPCVRLGDVYPSLCVCVCAPLHPCACVRMHVCLCVRVCV